MMAIEVTRFGGPDVLEPVTLPDPRPGPGQVAVTTTVAGVLWLDTVIRGGAGGDHFAVDLPWTPGKGAAGTVTAVGPGVDPGWTGRRVLADVVQGGYAEQLVAPADALVPVPENLADHEAMALLHDGRTALGLLENTPVTAGETVLVLPAAGGLGNLLVQLLVARGATVIGLSRKPDVVRDLGAVPVADPAELTMRPDVVFDGVGGAVGTAALGLLAGGGRFSGYGMASGSPTDTSTAPAGIATVGMDQLGALLPGAHDRAVRVLDEAAAGHVRAVIGRVDPLRRATDTHRALENREVAGKALLATS